MLPTADTCIYDPSAGDLRADFDSAVDFVGREWIEATHQDQYTNTEDTWIGHRPSELIAWYHAAKETLNDQDTSRWMIGSANESAIRFFQLGAAIQGLSGANVRSPTKSKPTLEELYRPDLQSAGQHVQEVVHELLTAAAYAQAGHSIAFINEGATDEKSPEFVLTDTDPEVEIECKHVRLQSHESEQISARLIELQNAIAEALTAPAIVTIETANEMQPAGVSEAFDEVRDLRLTPPMTVELPIGELRAFPLEAPFPYFILQSIVENEGLIPAVRRLLIEPTMAGLDLPIDVYSAGNWILPVKRRAVPLGMEIGFCAWIGIDREIDRTTNVDRARSQFSGVSGKFTEGRPGLLHINMPGYAQLPSKGQAQLRGAISGELAQRDAVTGAIVSLHEYHTEASPRVDLRLTAVPNYNPKNPMPEDVNPLGIDLSQAQSAHELLDDSLDETTTVLNAFRELVAVGDRTMSFRMPTDPIFQNKSTLLLTDFEMGALIATSGKGEWGIVDLLTETSGLFRFAVPPRFKRLETIAIAVTRGDNMTRLDIINPRIDLEVQNASIRLENPQISLEELHLEFAEILDKLS